MADELIIYADQVERPLPVDSPLHKIDPRILQQFSMEQLEMALENTQFAYTFPICGHISSQNKEISACTVLAGRGTKHEGIGRCLRHEGLMIKARSPYTQALREYTSLQQIFEDFNERANKLNNLSEEISVARTTLHMVVSGLDAKKPGKNLDLVEAINNCLECIRRIAHSMAIITQTESAGITEPAVRGFLWQVATILDEEISDSVAKIRIMDRIATEATFVEV